MDEFLPYLIPLSILSPLVAAVMLLFAERFGVAAARTIAFLGFAVPFLASLVLALLYSQAQAGPGGYRFVTIASTGLDWLGVQLHLGLNGISLPMYLLAGIVGMAAGLYALQSPAKRKSLYLGLLLTMHGGLMGTFASVDIFFFYFFHELALIPTFIMIGIWGGTERRVAAMEMTIYLTLGALLSLIGLISLYVFSGFFGAAGSFNLINLKAYVAAEGFSGEQQEIIFGLLLFGFGILVSLFPFHSWAPRGYAAAPASNAMLHAGVLKKFGLYGLIQIAAPLLPLGLEIWTPWILALALGNVIIIGLITMAQRDLKKLLGFSSVMHMGYAFLGIAAFSVIGWGGAILMMFAHGLSVALLFLLATAICQRTGTYDLGEMGGMAKRTPLLAGFFIAAIMANIGLPGMANFWGELSVFLSLWDAHAWAVYPAVAGIIISAIYGLRAVASICFGEPFRQTDPNGQPMQDLSLAERVPASLLLGTLLFFGIWPTGLGTVVDEELMALLGDEPPAPYLERLPENVITAPLLELSEVPASAPSLASTPTPLDVTEMNPPAP
ncbi:MAG: NuoM family protein [Opitutales bacterium]